MLAGGIELRRTGKTLRRVLSPGRKERDLAGAWRQHADREEPVVAARGGRVPLVSAYGTAA
jgi:hypothetical protein